MVMHGHVGAEGLDSGPVLGRPSLDTETSSQPSSEFLAFLLLLRSLLLKDLLYQDDNGSL